MAVQPNHHPHICKLGADVWKRGVYVLFYNKKTAAIKDSIQVLFNSLMLFDRKPAEK